jgi:tRNA-specific 2-thiouridylase
MSREFVAERPNFVAWDRLTEERPSRVMVRYRQAAAPADLVPLHDGRIRVRWREPQRLASPGQAAVFYDASDPDLVVGGGTVAQ